MLVVEETQAEYAKRRGVTPKAIEKAIGAGRIPASAVRREGRFKFIDVAAADRALGGSRSRVNTGRADPIISENFSSASSSASETPGLTKARTESAQIETRIKQLDLDERLGKLVPAEDVTRSMEICATALARDLDQLPSRADDLATAFTRSGVDGMRSLLKQIVREVRGTMASNMKLLTVEECVVTDGEEYNGTC